MTSRSIILFKGEAASFPRRERLEISAAMAETGSNTINLCEQLGSRLNTEGLENQYDIHCFDGDGTYVYIWRISVS